MFTPRVLKDGSDSVGALGALNRVYLNIGLFSEEWLLHFNGRSSAASRSARSRSPTRERNSVYWQATEQQTLDMALFFLASRPARTGSRTLPRRRDKYLTADAATLDRGKEVFAENCARCHSSKTAAPIVGTEARAASGCNGPDYLDCWNKYWALDQDGRVQAADAGDRARAGLPRRTTISRPSCACR